MTCLTSACNGRHLALLGAAAEARVRRTLGLPVVIDIVMNVAGAMR
jgi:hypothetical protein